MRRLTRDMMSGAAAIRVPGFGGNVKKLSLDWWAVIAALASVALVKAVNLPVGW